MKSEISMAAICRFPTIRLRVVSSVWERLLGASGRRGSSQSSEIRVTPVNLTPIMSRVQAMRAAVFSVVLLIFSASAVAKDKPAPKSAVQLASQVDRAAPSPLLATMQQELDREMTILSKADPAAYFMGYTITDSNHAEVTGSNGALLSSRQDHSRWLEAQVRVGSYQLDNTHRVGNGGTEPPGSFGEPVPIEDDAGVLRRAMWRETDSQYRAAAEALIKIKTGKDVQVQDAAQSAPDFSKEQPHVSYGPHASFTLDRKPWEEKVRQYTRFFHNVTGRS